MITHQFMHRIRAVAACAVLAFVTSAQAEQLALPSDAEMLKRGREANSKDLSSFDQAVRNTGQTVPLNLPSESTRQLPSTKDLSQEFFASDLNKQQQEVKGTELILFVSFSMPDDVLLEYSRQAKEAGAVVVMRGLFQNSIIKTQQKLYASKYAKATWEINPQAFRKYKVDRVPSIILADVSESQVLKDGSAAQSSFLRVDGEISLRQALLIMRQRGDGVLVKDAAVRLENLEKRQ